MASGCPDCGATIVFPGTYWECGACGATAEYDRSDREDHPATRRRAMHEIHVFDGGADHLLPGRWLARTNWLGPDYYGYGPTKEAAVEKLRTAMRIRDPNAPWFQSVPVVEQPL